MANQHSHPSDGTRKQHKPNFTRRDSHWILDGGWLSPSNKNRTPNDTTKEPSLDDDFSTVIRDDDTTAAAAAVKYAAFPLVRDMVTTENLRTAALEMDGRQQICYTKSNEGWGKTLFVFKGRALDQIMLPWALVTANAIVWTCVAELILPPLDQDDFVAFEGFFSLVVNATLAFLLVFRLNRSAERYWVARGAWGAVIALGRTIVSGVLVHGHHDAKKRDNVIRWVAAFAVSTMTFMHSVRQISPAILAGILEEKELQELQKAPHPPLHAMDEIRWNLQKLFFVDEHTPPGLAQARSQQLHLLEGQLNQLMDNTGTLERIKSTPLPLVYVTHLRTCLVLFLLCMPYVWQPSLAWGTIPIVWLASFAYLGLEGAAREVEAPFSKDRVNHLSMDAYVLMLMTNILQQIQQMADRDIERAKAQSPPAVAKQQCDTDALHAIQETNNGDVTIDCEIVSAKRQ